MWLDHLKTVDINRKRGAAKAAETRRCKRNTVQTPSTTDPEEDEYYCGVSRALYGDSDEAEYWVGCEKCDSWFHGSHINITPENEPDECYCSACV